MSSVEPTPQAPKSIQELKELLCDDTKVKVAVDGVLRGKYMSKDKFLSAVEGDGFGFCSVIFGWDIHDTVYTRELLISNKDNGYRDIIAKVDLSSYRRITWEYNVPFFLVSFLDPDTKEPICACPRGTLAKAIKLADKYDWKCLAGVEYEYFQFREDPRSVADKKFHQLEALTPGMHGYSMLRTQLNQDYFNDIFDEAKRFHIEIEGHHTETGPGVYETALAYTSALRMADNAILFKYLVKSLGMQKGVLPSFMAKPWGNLPGCSGHVHVSLKTKDGKNLFAVKESELKNGREDAQYGDTKWLSKEGEWFLAGILDGLEDIVPLLVPTINGYKRLVGGEAFWAPNAVTWGYDSRAASIRLITPPSCPPSATRMEVRVPGADMNPYLALSAIFLLGFRGIEKQLSIPVPPVKDLMNDKSKVIKLATGLDKATALFMREGSVAREVFGDEFVDHYGGTREHEVNLWNQAVTSWEVERYLELV
ncbi:hypothetical protein M408DRAFT_68625 [Serendipita vermifera MAFF 305830]|uniref:GS catalytic domain-containing protein n=1 Tax=Serendipita vermifera MAFF 305830 TaxID=933852 RepID=A0A0C3AX22_SERVB|nr:hypothetical protein M408DRAFT_68625 [Serendipita vermifera MAFF 305830]